MNFELKKSDLAFKVYTAASKPTTPGSQNDIAIISSVPMGNWVMSTKKPSGVPKSEGDVWLHYSVKGDLINALKSNSLMIAPDRAWQFVDGAWVDRESVICQDDTWRGLIPEGVLYYHGDERMALTGGWINQPWTFGSNGYSAVACNSLYKGDKSINMSVGGYTDKSTTLCTKEAIDLTKYKTLTFKGQLSGQKYWSLFAAKSTDYYYGSASGAVYTNAFSTSGNIDGTVTMDVSNANGSFIIGIGLAVVDTNHSATVTMEEMILS